MVHNNINEPDLLLSAWLSSRNQTTKAQCVCLQVSASAGQLDGVAQLLQQYRSQLQAAHASSQGLGLIRPDTLDELLFLTFLQGQFASRGWVQALELNNQLKADR